MTERTPPGSAGDNPQGTLRTAGPPRLGGVLGRYELLQVLGHGAMATVFRARDTHLGREVAVKVMTLAVAARADSAERFRREAQAVAAVKHPGIVEIFDFVAANETEPAYIVSELINGPTLRRFIDGRRGRVLPETAALLALPLAEALHAAHSRGVVHRDIKPDNVMLECGGNDRRIVLTDFGVAHVTGMETMTATGALVGSPSYMSPEQARGQDAGPASDLFSFGVLLYEMATGHLPFTGKDPLMILAAISRGVYKRPSQISGYAGPAFDEICTRCLRPLPGERFASAGAIAAELRRFCSNAGLDPGGASLRLLLDDAEAFEAQLRPRMADAAVAAARKHTRRAELARALAELSRATAYVPGHTEAERLMATISSRRRWAKVAAVLAGTVALGSGLSVVVPRVGDWWAGAVPEGAGSGAAAGGAAKGELLKDLLKAEADPKPGAKTGANSAAEVKPTPGAVTELQPTGGAKPGETDAVVASKPASMRERPRGRRDRGPATAAVVAPPVAGGDAGQTGGGGGGPPGSTATTTSPATVLAAPDAGSAPARAQPEPVAVTLPAVPASAPAAAVSVEVYASNAFCNPSLDDLRPSVTPARYHGVKPGVHRVYCNSPGSPPRLVAELPIGPPQGGGSFRIQLRKDAAGKAFVDRKATSVVAEVPAAEPPPPAPAPTPPD